MTDVEVSREERAAYVRSMRKLQRDLFKVWKQSFGSGCSFKIDSSVIVEWFVYECVDCKKCFKVHNDLSYPSKDYGIRQEEDGVRVIHWFGISPKIERVCDACHEYRVEFARAKKAILEGT